MAEREAERIEREIARNRAEMSETIDALERRLSPGELFDELWTRMRGGETGANVSETIRDHPVPLAMMGLGLGWLAIEKATQSRSDELRARHGAGAGTYERAEGRVGPYRGDDVIDSDPRHDEGPGMTDRIRDAAGGLKDRVTELADDARDRLGESREPAFDGGHTHTGHTRSTVYGDISYAGSQDGDGLALRDRATELRQGADRQMQHAREKVQEGSRRVSHGFQRAVEDYPLALGAVTFGLGLAAGLGIPTSERENALMGDAADTLKDEVRRTARTAAEAARDVAGEAGRTVRDEPDWQEPPGI